jgi:hypothetical protein
MKTLFAIGLIVIIIVLFVLIWAIAKEPPMGYEDEEGFHVGKEPDHE